MFGIIIARKSTIIREVQAALREAHIETAAAFRSGPLRDEMIALAKRAGERARQASRPVVTPKAVRGDSPDNDLRSQLLQAAGMSFFKGVSNARLAEMLRQDRAQAFKEAGEELAPIFLKIARGEPVDLQAPTTPPPKMGVLSGFFARIGL